MFRGAAVTIKAELILGVDQSIEAFGIFLNSLSLPTDELTGNFYHIITAIGRVAIKNYAALRQAFDDDCHEVLAWSCRNLLELDIFTKYVLLSKANADEFAAHRLIDGLEIAERLREFELSTNASLAVSAFEPTIGQFNSTMAAAGIVRSPYLSAKRLAKAVNMEDVYEAMNKVCSKMVHPTAWAILTEDVGSRRFPEARQIFYGSGSEYTMEIYISIKDHIHQFGLRHKPISPIDLDSL
jgi:Family of unknown function (DUF5677)